MTSPAVGQWACSRRSLPVFVNGDCSLPGFIHIPSCQAACTVDGFPSDRRCRCGAAVSMLPAWTAVRLLEITNAAFLVEQPDSGPFWIEHGPINRAKAPVVDAGPRAAPPDFLAVELALATEPVRAGRRKRYPQGSEIVFVRSDLREAETAIPWRLLCEVTRPEGRCALLIDPSLSTDRALTSGWMQQRVVPLVIDGKLVERDRILVPAFPIGRVEDPGWK